MTTKFNQHPVTLNGSMLKAKALTAAKTAYYADHTAMLYELVSANAEPTKAMIIATLPTIEKYFDSYDAVEFLADSYEAE